MEVYDHAMLENISAPEDRMHRNRRHFELYCLFNGTSQREGKFVPITIRTLILGLMINLSFVLGSTLLHLTATQAREYQTYS